MSLITLDFVVCGTYHWSITVPKKEVTLRLQKQSGETWSLRIPDPQAVGNNPAKREHIEEELLRVMYPVTESYDMWVEGKDGKTIGYESPEPTGAQQHVTGMVKRTAPDGSTLFWLGDRCPMTHRISLGRDMKPLEILATQWPPAVFFQGNNRMHVDVLLSLDEDSISTFVKSFENGIKKLGDGIIWFITQAYKPRTLE